MSLGKSLYLTFTAFAVMSSLIAGDNGNEGNSNTKSQLAIISADSVPAGSQDRYISISDMMDMMAARQSRIMDQFMNDSFYMPAANMPLNSSYPQSKMVNSKDNYTYEIIVPGADKKNINIQLDGRTLKISYRNSTENSNQESAGYRSYTEEFEQYVTIPPDGNTEKITSTCKDGILTVNIPKLDNINNKSKTIAID